MPDQPAQASSMDQNKLFAIIGYVVPMLFFLPLVTEAKNDAFAKYHANQQLNLLLFWVVGSVASTVLAFVLIGALLMPIVWIAGLVFMVLGIMNASKGEMKPLPLIGGFSLLK